MTPFELLEIHEEADDAEIKQAYLRKVRDYPPERAPDQFQRIRDAYEHIQTREKRLKYTLFHTHEPDATEIIGHMLKQCSKPQRPSLEAFQSALAASLQIEK
jgi:DnaJ-class molecular chaperone